MTGVTAVEDERVSAMEEPYSTSLQVRKARPDEEQAVLAFYHEMIEVMKGTDFDICWTYDVHPANDFLRTSTQQGCTYLGIADDGNIACACIIDSNPAPGYENADWMVHAAMHEIGIVHSVATLPQYHRRGFARKLMEAAIADARKAGFKSLQLDTLVTNKRAHNLYRQLGFRDAGLQEVFYEDLGAIELQMFEYVM